jgi:hypothetical protein
MLAAVIHPWLQQEVTSHDLWPCAWDGVVILNKKYGAHHVLPSFGRKSFALHLQALHFTSPHPPQWLVLSERKVITVFLPSSSRIILCIQFFALYFQSLSQLLNSMPITGIYSVAASNSNCYIFWPTLQCPWPPLWSSGLVLGYRSEARVRVPALPEKKSSGSGTGSTQPREYNWGTTW